MATHTCDLQPPDTAFRPPLFPIPPASHRRRISAAVRSSSFRVFLIAAASALVLSGCGWRLQGAARLSEAAAVTYIEAEDRYTPFNMALRESLRASGAQIASGAGEASAIVRVLREETGQRVLSVSARNTPEEYEVFYTIEYSVADQTGEVIAPQRLEVTRDYSYDPTAVLAKQREQAILRDALARDLAALVVRRLASL